MTKRRRATAIVVNKHGEILLVRDKGKRHFSLPGGGIKHNEPSISAAAREVYEETGFVIHSLKWVLNYESKHSDHRVYLAEGHGKARTKSEISSFKWWKPSDKLPVFDSVNKIVSKAGLSGKSQNAT